jgi:hypothetical protein
MSGLEIVQSPHGLTKFHNTSRFVHVKAVASCAVEGHMILLLYPTQRQNICNPLRETPYLTIA